jgi:hypothetical protein
MVQTIGSPDEAIDIHDNNLASYYLSPDIILDNIEEQIKDLNGSYDYATLFEEKYEYMRDFYNSKEKTAESIEYIQNLDDIRDNFYEKLFTLIMEKFSFSVVLKDTLLNEEKYKLIKGMYKFFVCNIRDTIKSFYMNTINDEKKAIIDSYKESINKSDMMYTLIKKEVSDDTDNAILVYAVKDVYKDIELEDIETFIETVIKGDESEEINDMMNDIFCTMEESVDISCHLNDLMKIIRDYITNDSNLIMEIQTELVSSLK